MVKLAKQKLIVWRIRGMFGGHVSVCGPSCPVCLALLLTNPDPPSKGPLVLVTVISGILGLSTR